jgi:hypothetical protein
MGAQLALDCLHFSSCTYAPVLHVRDAPQDSKQVAAMSEAYGNHGQLSCWVLYVLISSEWEGD